MRYPKNSSVQEYELDIRINSKRKFPDVKRICSNFIITQQRFPQKFIFHHLRTQLN